MQSISSTQLQNNFGAVLDQSQREMVSITRRGRVVSLIMSPEVLEDYIDGMLATKAKEHMLTPEESKAVLDRFR